MKRMVCGVVRNMLKKQPAKGKTLAAIEGDQGRLYTPRGLPSVQIRPVGSAFKDGSPPGSVWLVGLQPGGGGADIGPLTANQLPLGSCRIHSDTLITTIRARRYFDKVDKRELSWCRFHDSIALSAG